jgi:hypothetical protein
VETLVWLFAGSALLGTVSMLAAFRAWKRVNPGITLAAFVLDSRPAQGPDLVAWRWGRLALSCMTAAGVIGLVLCVLQALGLKSGRT